MQQKSELPEGWISTKFEEITQNFDGKRIPLKSSDRIKRQGQYPYYGASGIIDNIDDYIFDGEFLLISEDGANLVARSTPIAFTAKGQFWVNNHAHIVKTHSNIPLEFLSYFFNSIDLLPFVTGSAQPKLTQGNLNNIDIPLPPLFEQQRIVSAIESLFARLDATNEKLDRVPEILKKFKQSVLAAACDGRLTEGWRKENRIKEDSWSNLEFFDFCVLQRGYDLPISKRRDGPYPIMASSGILAYHDECKASGPGVVVGRSGSTGKTHYVEEDYWPHNTTLFVKDFKENYPKFVYLFLINFNLEQYSASTAVPTLNRNNLRGIIVSIPPLTEQQEIVKRVDALFTFAYSIEKKVVAAREKTEKLRQSILAKAFSGELVETEAEVARREGRDYETAEVLLERIKKEKGKNGKNGKKR